MCNAELLLPYVTVISLHAQRPPVIAKQALGVLCTVKFQDRASALLLLVGWVKDRCLARYACTHHPSDSSISLATIAESK